MARALPIFRRSISWRKYLRASGAGMNRLSKKYLKPLKLNDVSSAHSVLFFKLAMSSSMDPNLNFLASNRARRSDSKTTPSRTSHSSLKSENSLSFRELRSRIETDVPSILYSYSHRPDERSNSEANRKWPGVGT